MNRIGLYKARCRDTALYVYGVLIPKEYSGSSGGTLYDAIFCKNGWHYAIDIDTAEPCTQEEESGWLRLQEND